MRKGDKVVTSNGSRAEILWSFYLMGSSLIRFKNNLKNDILPNKKIMLIETPEHEQALKAWEQMKRDRAKDVFSYIEGFLAAKKGIEEKNPTKEIVEKEEIFKDLQNIIMDIFNYDRKDISADFILVTDYDTEFPELLKKIEEFFKMRIPNEAWEIVETLGDLVDIIYNKK